MCISEYYLQALVAVCLLIPQSSCDAPTAGSQPEQIHIALGEAPYTMSVTWVTMNETPSSVVEYGEDYMFKSSVQGSMSKFIDGGKANRTLYMHRALLTHLKPLHVYKYHVGSALGWSDVFYFKQPRSDSQWSPRLILFGDMGNANAQSLARIQQEVQRNTVDAILHVGDLAYDIATDDAKVGDAFMRQIEAVAAYIPYMTCPGNHEYHYNFSNYRARFTMPNNGDGEGLYYSFDFGMAHIISFSSEFFYYPYIYDTEHIHRQMAWLKADLETANRNRAEFPWIITMAHRPAYCSSGATDDCSKLACKTRKWTEDLFYKYGVDISFWAHEHFYERTWPIYNYTVCNGSESAYVNPQAPVHITTGSAGCRERHDPISKTKPYFSAARTQDYGYSHMTIHNATHISINQISDDKGGVIVDQVTIVKDRRLGHVPSYSCHLKKDPKQEQLQTELFRYREKMAAAGKFKDA